MSFLNLVFTISVVYTGYRILKKISPKLPIIVGSLISLYAAFSKRNRIMAEVRKLLSDERVERKWSTWKEGK